MTPASMRSCESVPEREQGSYSGGNVDSTLGRPGNKPLRIDVTRLTYPKILAASGTASFSKKNPTEKE